MNNKPLKLTVITLAADIEQLKPIDSLGLLFKNVDDVYNLIDNEEDLRYSMTYFNNRPQHIYFLSDEKIKAGDFYYCGMRTNKYGVCKCDSERLEEICNGVDEVSKIVASTDKSLGLSLISKEFIKEYANKSGELKTVFSGLEKNEADEIILINPTENISRFITKKDYEMFNTLRALSATLKANISIDSEGEVTISTNDAVFELGHEEVKRRVENFINTNIKIHENI